MSTGPGRDLRLDLFRGLALLFIFLNHIPNNVASWATNRNFGFSDATEIFVFISGYAAALAYGGAMRRTGFAPAAVRILRRCGQIYVAHILLFVVFTAHIAWVAERYANPMYVEEMLVVSFLDEPHVALTQALLLKFTPANMDVLPLYVLLLLAFPPALRALLAWPNATLAFSFALYAAARTFGWNAPAYPSGQWFFNPLAWQFLFVLGAWCALRFPADAARRIAPVLDLGAVAMVLFALWIVATWHFPQIEPSVPVAVRQVLYPIDKTGLDPLRLAHFLALAWLASRLVPRRARVLSAPFLQPVMLCGRQSLYVFCAGTILSFVGHWLLVEVDGSVAAQLAVSFAGCCALVFVAAGVEWFKRMESASLERRPAPSE